ncbi:DUF4340 domain-containing protein, partial [Tyzzerella sp. OttesenSCG-928-J15]|nr:DUF4340 domain-containing protein [Tyzzerella sp. OttesenSCG-928-J15]
LHIGKRTPDAKYYYAKLEGDQRIFTIAATTGERYFYGYNDFLNKSIPQIDVASIDYMEFKIGGNDYSFDLSFPYGVEYLGWFRKEYVAEQTGYGKRLNMQYVNQYMLAGLENIRLSGVVIDGAHNLAQYGLDDPVTMLHINDGENDLHFYLGATDESGLRYIMLEGENYVYTAQAAYFNAVESADMSGIFNRRLTDVVVKQARTAPIYGKWFLILAYKAASLY